jgi:Glycerophosphoryl diester phosphodiesterase family
MRLEIQAHRGNDRLTLRRLLAARPSSVELDVGVREGELVVAHGVDLADASGLSVERALAAAGETRLVLEAKCFPPVTLSPRSFALALRPYLDRVAVSSFDERVLDEVGRFRSVETTLLFTRPLRVATAARTIGPRQELVNRELLDAAHALGLRVVPWTVNDVRRIAELIDLGVDGLVTDEPALARAIAAERFSAAA